MANRAAGEGGAPPATEMMMAAVAPGDQKSFDTLRVSLESSTAEFPGFAGLEVFTASPGDGNWAAVLTFESNAALQQWRASPERAEVLRGIRAVADNRDWVLPAGFRRWSSGDTSTAQGPAWKQAMTALAVLYAIVSILDITLGNFIGKGLSVEGRPVVSGLGLPFPLVVFVGNAVSTVLLTWVLMPLVTRLLNWWLNPAASRAQTIRGVAILVLIYVIEVWFFVWVFETFGF